MEVGQIFWRKNSKFISYNLGQTNIQLPKYENIRFAYCEFIIAAFSR